MTGTAPATANTRDARRAPPIALIALLVCAVALGAAADRAWLMREGRLTPPGFPPLAPMKRPTPEEEATLRTKLKETLGITPEQGPAVDRIVSAQITMLEQLRADVRPRLDSIFEVTRVALDSVLTADQRARRDALLRQAAPFIDSIGVPKR